MSADLILVLSIVGWLVIALVLYLVPAFFPELHDQIERNVDLPPLAITAALWPIAIVCFSFFGVVVYPIMNIGKLQRRIYNWSHERIQQRKEAIREEQRKREKHADRYT